MSFAVGPRRNNDRNVFFAFLLFVLLFKQFPVQNKV